MVEPFFSILLPTHNRADVLSFAIESVRAQTFKSWELLIVGDGCTDETENVAKSYLRKDKRIRWFNFPKGRGFGYEHRNTVLLEAKGDLVAFIAHDDLWFSDHLSNIFNFIEKSGHDPVVYTRPLWVHHNGSILPSTFNIHNPSVSEIFFHKHNEIPASCVVHSRKDLVKVGGWNDTLTLAADWDLWKRILEAHPGKTSGFLSMPTTLHFKADWRPENNYMAEALINTYDLLRKNQELLVTLRTPKNEPMQVGAWKLMQKKGWIDLVRNSAVIQIDILARSAVDTTRSVRLLKEKNRQLQNDLQRVTNTKGYQLIEYLRKIRSVV